MRYVTILVVLALSLLGCGGSDGDTDAAAATTTSTTSVDGGNDATTTSQPTDTTDPPDGDVDFTNCPEWATQWSSDWGAANQAAISGGADPNGFEYTAEYFQEFADRAPDEISDDMQVIADAFRNLFDAMEELDIDFSDPSSMAGMTAEDAEKLEEAFGFMDNDAIEEASTNIAEYFERECS